MNHSSNKAPLLLLLFVPVLAAVLLLWKFTGSTDAVAKVSLSSPVSGETEYTQDEDLRFFSRLVGEAEVIEQAVRPQEEYQQLNLTVKTMTAEKQYSLLLSGSPSDCLFTDANSVLYRIPPELAQVLLLKPELEYVNPNYAFPEVTVSAGGQTITLTSAQTLSWNYLSADQSFHQRSAQGTQQSVFVLGREQSPTLQFSRAPHWTNVIVTKGNAELFNGTAEGLSSFLHAGDGDLTVQVQAKWNKEEGCRFYGESTLRFTLRCDAPASFAISTESCYPGDPITLLAKNCQNAPITISTTLAGAEQAKTVDYCGEKVILLPVALSNKPGSYEITVSGEGVSQSFTLQVNKKEFSDETLTNLNIAEMKTAHAKEQEQLASIMSSSAAEPLWNGNFSEPMGGEDAWISCRFGAYVTMEGTNTGLRHGGLDYVQLPQSFVAAANDGVVVFAGTLAYSGTTVVIDHGLGIFSIYGSLDSLNVSEGMKVYKSQTVGTLGNSGFAGGSCLHFEFRISGVSVNPYSFLGKDPDFFDLRVTGT